MNIGRERENENENENGLEWLECQWGDHNDMTSLA